MRFIWIVLHALGYSQIRLLFYTSCGDQVRPHDDSTSQDLLEN